MRKHAHLVVGESRWFPVSAVLAAAALTPSAAHASSKLLNDKSLADSKAACPVAASFAPAARADISRAILGGAPSALDRIRADQQAIAAPAVTPASPITAGLDAFPVRHTLEPASRTPISFAPAPSCGTPSSFAPLTETAEYDPSAELGTRAIPVKRTRFDDRWDHVRRAAPAGLMQSKLRSANASSGLAEQDLLARVNQWVNREIAYVNDDRNYRQRDFWATAEQTLGRGKGDCEDFAILKMQMLRAAGIDADRMKLVLLRDLAANADHAFLLVQTDAGKVVLDNVTDRLYDGSQSNSVRPVLSFSENRRWVHAYRGTQSSPNLTAIPASQKSYTLALNNQRSVSADPLTFKTGFSK
ncbi:transglutaminase-like cysteine proteinase BTLCP [Sphingopyxis sp. YR583]|jgi:predicted transglutaminase-like cysteine proteinase|uniref:transglutaminase-like cysteine peptidase n=1 Tax=Sphingopyxis sp. YR583 TaxID=1881047 RepID=UPI0008A7B128|nr:transglutaminase-like cysteine peptidase [Sphingopyxis sp. YR583]SEH14739.1 transglutaminase-like cysteine proteinase BTLCP [Sphingopyxis sp. YR583]